MFASGVVEGSGLVREPDSKNQGAAGIFGLRVDGEVRLRKMATLLLRVLGWQFPQA